MNAYAFLNHKQKRVTGICMAKSTADAARSLGENEREIRVLPDDGTRWSLATATHYFFPETLITLGSKPR